MALTAGTRLGPYEITGPLGVGGMGEVYRATDTRLGRQVAVKILPRDLAEDADRRARFEREARAASALSHPGIITVHDVGREGEIPFLVMELVEGQSLRSILADGPMPLRRALGMAAQVASGLARAHAAGIVHRDLKPDNIMVAGDDQVKILDFGLAKARPSSADHVSQLATAADAGTRDGVVVGTPGYMAPEQIRGVEVDAQADQFALGLVLYEMLSASSPFRRETAVQTMSAILQDEAEPLVRSGVVVPPQVQWLLDRCLAKQPADRYAATADLARDLATLRDHLSELSQPGRPGVTQPARRRGGGIGLFALGWLAGLLVAAVAAMALAPAWFGKGVPAPALALRSLTHSGYDGQPDVSPDGRMLTFSSAREAHPRIWLRQISSGREVPLTAGPDIYPRFSPDGSMVLFAHMSPEGVSLHRVPILGGEPRRVLENAAEGDWFPDGARLAFLRVGRREDEALVSEVGVVPAGGGEETILASLAGYALFGPRVSPDGRWIAASASTLGLSEGENKFVYLVPSDGGPPRRLAPALEGGDPSAVAWLPTGRSLIYAQGESVSSVSLARSLVNLSASRLVLQDIATADARTLLAVPYLVSVLDLMGDDRLVFDGVAARQSLGEYRLDGSTASAPRVLARGSHIDRQPVYTPDGRAVAFSSNRSGNLDIWLLTLEDGDLRPLTDHPADDWDPAFTADGRHLIFTSRRSGRFEIWMAEADGSSPRQVSSDGVDAENASPTPDGQWLVYNSGNADHPGLWKVRRDGSEARHLMEGSMSWPEVSPDGEYVAFAQVLTSGVSLIRTLRLADGQPLPFQIRLLPSTESVGRTRWLPGGRALAFTAADESGRTGVFAQDFDPDSADTSASRRVLAMLPPGVLPETFGIAPDGRHATIAASEKTWSLLQAENLPGLGAAQDRP